MTNPTEPPNARVYAVWCPAAADDPEISETFVGANACEAAELYARLTAEDYDGTEEVLRLRVQNLNTRETVTVEVEIEYVPKYKAKVTS